MSTDRPSEGNLPLQEWSLPGIRQIVEEEIRADLSRMNFLSLVGPTFSPESFSSIILRPIPLVTVEIVRHVLQEAPCLALTLRRFAERLSTAWSEHYSLSQSVPLSPLS